MNRDFMRLVTLVARRDYLRTVRRRGFVAGTLLLPLAMGAIFAISAFASTSFTSGQTGPVVAAFHRAYADIRLGSHWDGITHDSTKFPKWTDAVRAPMMAEISAFFEEVAFNGGTFKDLFRELAATPAVIERFAVEAPNLAEIFVRAVTGDEGGVGADAVESPVQTA